MTGPTGDATAGPIPAVQEAARRLRSMSLSLMTFAESSIAAADAIAAAATELEDLAAEDRAR